MGLLTAMTDGNSYIGPKRSKAIFIRVATEYFIRSLPVCETLSGRQVIIGADFGSVQHGAHGTTQVHLTVMGPWNLPICRVVSAHLTVTYLPCVHTLIWSRCHSTPIQCDWPGLLVTPRGWTNPA